MANITSANGKIALVGDWPAETINKLNEVAQNWSFYGEFGIHGIGHFSQEKTSEEFSGVGRWSFLGTLAALDEWTKDFEKINQTTYQDLLSEMKEHDLSLELTYVDQGDEYKEWARSTLSSNGQKLLHHQEETDDYDWELALKLGDYKQKDFEACCSIFQDFAPKADPEELNRWVRFFAPPAADYIDYIKKEDRSYLYEDILLMDTDFFPESLVIFYHDFSPESKQWQKLTAQVEDFASVTWEELLEEYPPLF